MVLANLHIYIFFKIETRQANLEEKVRGHKADSPELNIKVNFEH